MVNAPEVPDPLENTAAGVFIAAMADTSANEEIISGETTAPTAETPEAPTAEVPAASGENTGKEDATVEGNGDGNGQVPPGQTEDADGRICSWKIK